MRINIQQSRRQYRYSTCATAIKGLWRFLCSLLLVFGSLLALSSCHSQYDDGSMEGHYDTIQQNRTSDQTMSSQQHDGLNAAKRDTAAADTLGQR